MDVVDICAITSSAHTTVHNKCIPPPSIKTKHASHPPDLSRLDCLLRLSPHEQAPALVCPGIGSVHQPRYINNEISLNKSTYLQVSLVSFKNGCCSHALFHHSSSSSASGSVQGKGSCLARKKVEGGQPPTRKVPGAILPASV